MSSDVFLFASMLAFAALVALPAIGAARRRHAMCEASEVAGMLAAMAREVRRRAPCPPEAPLWRRAQRLNAPEFPALLLAQELAAPGDELLADTAQRFATRLKRRVAFERKMLARTASGRRRGAIAASIPPLALLALRAGGIDLPIAALLFVVAVEGCGCWLLWRLARVEI